MSVVFTRTEMVRVLHCLFGAKELSDVCIELNKKDSIYQSVQSQDSLCTTKDGASRSNLCEEYIYLKSFTVVGFHKNIFA